MKRLGWMSKAFAALKTLGTVSLITAACFVAPRAFAHDTLAECTAILRTCHANVDASWQMLAAGQSVDTSMWTATILNQHLACETAFKACRARVPVRVHPGQMPNRTR
jgi:hypothetical protein